MQRERLIKAIETYSAISGLKPSTICQYAVQNRHFYSNLVSGGDYRASTAERVIRWIKEHPASSRKDAK